MSIAQIVLTVVAGSDDNLEKLKHVQSEVEEIAKIIRESDFRDSFASIIECGTSEKFKETFSKRFSQRNIFLYHFAGHGSLEGLAFEAVDGGLEHNPVSHLKALLLAATNIQMIFLNGCETSGLAHALKSMPNCVLVYSHQRIDDRVASEFAKAYYRKLFQDGSSFQEAFYEAEVIAEREAQKFGVPFRRFRKVFDETGSQYGECTFKMAQAYSFPELTMAELLAYFEWVHQLKFNDKRFAYEHLVNLGFQETVKAYYQPSHDDNLGVLGRKTSLDADNGDDLFEIVWLSGEPGMEHYWALHRIFKPRLNVSKMVFAIDLTESYWKATGDNIWGFLAAALGFGATQNRGNVCAALELLLMRREVIIVFEIARPEKSEIMMVLIQNVCMEIVDSVGKAAMTQKRLSLVILTIANNALEITRDMIQAASCKQDDVLVLLPPLSNIHRIEIENWMLTSGITFYAQFPQKNIGKFILGITNGLESELPQGVLINLQENYAKVVKSNMKSFVPDNYRISWKKLW